MSFLASIPVIGDIIEKIGEAIDRNVTTDDERLKAKAAIMALYIPLLTAVLDAQKAMNELQVKMAEIEAKSEHFIVWARRPIIAIFAALNFVAAAIFHHMDVDTAFYFACLVNGLDTGTRGLEKVATVLKSKEAI